MGERDTARVVRQGLAVGLATAAYGVSFGALSVLSGLDVAQTCFLSLVLFSGGSQFALIGVLATGGAAAAGIGVTSAALLGSRNLFYAVRLAPLLRYRPLRALAAAQLTIDESTAVAIAQTEPRLQRLGFWVTGATVYLGWNLTTLIGALLGNLLGDVRAFGLDAAAAAAFLALLWPRLAKRQARAVAAASAVLAAALVPALPAGVPVLLTVVVAIVVGATNLLGPKAAA
ncbi:AzlC family ABC transporter permease [Amnibacterium sp. CER49]|uniref:AzlC family ABC transporter permease n=1 Tax=Amnibacterium sp. CER49 TaxID=3039161 RepID=UPI002449F62B|nr:AzlC family ABC transporter permease [Amnibacterium sp. CER49]MDH2445470.1 AzlC family ABC transporter permease [Amnibacterium sp. CER49]